MRSVVALLSANCHRLSSLAEGLAAPSRRGLLQLLEAIAVRLDALAERAEQAPADVPTGYAQSLRNDIQSIQAELAIVQATLKGRVESRPAHSTRTEGTKETRQMARKPWLFDPDNVSELELGTSDGDDLKLDDEGWEEWDDWNDDDEPEGLELADDLEEEPRGKPAAVRDWKGHSPRARGHRRSRSHRQL